MNNQAVPMMLKIHLSRSKCDQFGKGVDVFVGRSGPFPEFNAHFSATAGWHFSRDLTRRLLIGECGQSHVSVKNG